MTIVIESEWKSAVLSWATVQNNNRKTRNKPKQRDGLHMAMLCGQWGGRNKVPQLTHKENTFNLSACD